MNNTITEIRPGDVISAHGHHFTVVKILYSDYYGTRSAARGSSWWGFDVEFLDTRGDYHHWKQNEDGGEVIRSAK